MGDCVSDTARYQKRSKPNNAVETNRVHGVDALGGNLTTEVLMYRYFATSPAMKVHPRCSLFP